MLATYRNSAIHFYNDTDFRSLPYALVQTSIINFKDLLGDLFDIDLSENINWVLLPVGVRPPIDAIQYLSNKPSPARRPAVAQFIGEVAAAVSDVKAAKADSGRLLTSFAVKLESKKKVQKSDVHISIAAPGASDSGPLTIIKTVDPNKSHPLRQKDLVAQLDKLHGVNFTSHTFQAIVWKYQLRSKAEYCWRAEGGLLTKYSNDIVSFIRSLSAADLRAALTDYRRKIRGGREQAK